MIREKPRREHRLRAVRPNLGIAAAYRRKLLNLIQQMQVSYVWFIRAQYRETPPIIAQDEEKTSYPRAPGTNVPKGFTGVAESIGASAASGELRWTAYVNGEMLRSSHGVGRRFKTAEAAEAAIRKATIDTPARELQAELAKLGARWQANFDKAAPKLAEYFAKAAANRSDAALRKILRDAGFSVRFKLTPAMRDVLDATVAENVSLIRSIASEYHTQVEGLVMRSVTAGRDLSFLTKELQKRYGVSKRRAQFISLDQSNKATSALQRTRQLELNLETGIWLHSGGGKHPRPTHVRQSGKKFSIRDGWPDPALNGKKIWPGTEPRCRCVWRPVVRGFS